MRRATVLVPAVAAILVAVALALAPAAGSAPERPARYSVAFKLRSEGFRVYLGNESDGDTASLAILRGGQIAVYETVAKITPRTFEARFGRLGRIDLRFRPVPGSNRKGTLLHGGEFEGTIAFTGEHGYIHLDAHRVHGSIETYSPGGSNRPRPATSPEDEVSLRALDRDGHGGGRFLTAHGVRTSAGVQTYVYGGEVERREGMTIIRGAQAHGPSAFRWSLAAGRATIDPPAPLAGTAVFRRRPDRRARWSGSLRAPLLGMRRPVGLTGPAFRAKLYHEEVHDERPGSAAGDR